MNWKRLPILVLSSIVAALPIILLYQQSDGTDIHATRFFGGMGLGAILLMGFVSVIYQTVWSLGRTSGDDLAPQIFGVIAVAVLVGTLSLSAILAWPPSGVVIYVLLWAAAYVFFKPFHDKWIALG